MNKARTHKFRLTSTLASEEIASTFSVLRSFSGVLELECWRVLDEGWSGTGHCLHYPIFATRLPYLSYPYSFNYSAPITITPTLIAAPANFILSYPTRHARTSSPTSCYCCYRISLDEIRLTTAVASGGGAGVRGWWEVRDAGEMEVKWNTSLATHSSSYGVRGVLGNGPKVPRMEVCRGKSLVVSRIGLSRYGMVWWLR